MVEKVKTALMVIAIVALVVLDIALQWIHYVQCAYIYGYKPTVLGFMGLPFF